MKYGLFLYEDEANFFGASEARQGEIIAAYMAYGEALNAAGVFVAGEALEPSKTGALVRMQGGVRDVQDGPFADVKEQLGGFYVIDVPDLDTALDWAAKCPAAEHGEVEVRPAVVFDN
ncbi:MAG: YciI family protein [Pseudomonadota bacterium]